MRQTKKYTLAKERLTFAHKTQQELYSELNRLGWFWDSKRQWWVRDDTVPDPVNDVVKIRVCANGDKAADLADLVVEQMECLDFNLIEKSEPCPLRPPKQRFSHVYLSFVPSSK